MARPKIVHVYKDVWPPIEGGIERTIFNLVHLTKDEFDPSVIVAARSTKRAVRRIDSDVEVLEVPSLGRALSTPLAPGFITALKKSKADLFHFHVPHPTGEVAYLLSGLKTPAVATYHSDVVRQKAALAVYNTFFQRFLARMKVIMPTSERYLETSEQLARHRDRCEVVPLGLPLEDYRLDDETEKLKAEILEREGDFIFFLGVLRYYKGLDVLIEAMRQLPNRKLIIAGDGPERTHLERLASGLEDRVRFIGAIDHPTAVAHFHAARVFCLPATQRSEAFGLCQIEAMACGLPVVSTDLPTGVPEINRHEKTGIIVPPSDSNSLAKALNKILDSNELRENLSAAARERAWTNYRAERMALKVKEIYRQALA